MRRLVALVTLIAVVAALSAVSQTPNVKVKVRAVLYDRDLNQKPVPHLALTFHNLDKGTDTTAQTSLAGSAEIELPPAKYRIASAKSVEFRGNSYAWEFTQEFTKADNLLELSNDNARVTDLTGGRGAQVDSLAEHFRALKGSAVTVWAQDGHGTGFLVDPAGFIVTNQHVTAGYTYLAAQFDGGRKLAAELLAEDKQKDVSVLRVNLAAVPDAAIAPIAQGSGTLLEGERVFTIGNPLDQEKVLTTGVVSKVDTDSIISDISISAGNSGGALFNSSGVVVGITTYRTGGGAGAGLSGIVPISQAAEALARARSKAAGSAPPSARLLPVAPPLKFPAEGLRAIGDKPWQKEIYSFKLGNFDVEIVTPVTRYQAAVERQTRAEKEREKRAKKSGAPPEASQKPMEYETKYDSVIRFDVSPQLKTEFWKSIAVPGGPIFMKFKSDFLRMRLLCDAAEIEPILPGRFPVSFRMANGSVYVDDATYEGAYTYPPDAISPKCKQISVEVVPVKEPDKPLVKVLDPSAVTQIWNDFDPFRKAQEAVKTAK